MTTHYFDGRHRRISHARYQFLITQWIIRVLGGQAPYTTNRQGRITSVTPVRVQQNENRTTASVAPHCTTAPYVVEIDDVSPMQSSQTNHKETEHSVCEKNKTHPCNALKELIERAIEKKQLEEYLATTKTDTKCDSIDISRYTATWGYELKPASTNKYQVSKSAFTQLKKERRQRSKTQQSAKIVDNYHTERYQYFRKAVLPKLSYRVFHKIQLEKLANTESSQQFNKRMAQYNGSELEDFLESQGILEEMPSNESHFGVDANGELLYVYIVDGLPQWQQSQIYLAILELITKFPNQKPGKQDMRHAGDVDGVSVYHLLDWCPRGHWNEKCVSKQTLANGKVLAVDSIIKLTKAMKYTRIQLSALLEAAAPDQYEENRKAIAKTSTEAYNKLLKACEQDVYLGCVLNTGQCRLHRDWNDRKGKLSAMTPFGFFVGGDMCLPQLGIKFKYAPGNILLCCTQALEHFIARYEGYRVGTVHCSHEVRMQQFLKNEQKEVDVDVDMFLKEFADLFEEEIETKHSRVRQRSSSLKEDSDEEDKLPKKKRKSKQAIMDEAEYRP